MTAVRFGVNPIVTPASSPSLGTNINGPSLIRIPDWVQKPLGRYYLYFAHHKGAFIRLAYADRLAGPWKVHEPGALKLAEAPACVDHIASPDVHVDAASREIRMYFHCPTNPRTRRIPSGRFSRRRRTASTSPRSPRPSGPTTSGSSGGAAVLRHRARRRLPAIA